ncbi:MAG: hypothetical protein GY711_03720 [bacterium]|nr:hypothetical protein [bacterium]
MSSTYEQSIPLEHVFAEVAAIPFAAEASLEVGLCAVEARMRSKRRGDAMSPTARVWRAVEPNLIAASAGLSIDQIVAIRDLQWFPSTDERVKLGSILVELAASVLERRGRVAVPRMPSTNSLALDSADLPGELLARRAWRWLSFALPPDLLLAALDVDSEGDPPVCVDGMPNPLRHQLADHGFAELHLHLGAALEFSHLWVGLLHALGAHSTPFTAFASPGAALDEGQLLGALGLRAALGRQVLGAFLASRGTGLRAFLREAQERSISARLGVSAALALQRALDELARGSVSHVEARRGHPELCALYQRIADLGRHRSLPRDPDELLLADPVAPYLHTLELGGASAEILLVREGLRYMRRNPSDGFFELLFWQMVRVRGLFYRHFVHRPLTPGLQMFRRTYERLAAARRFLPRELLVASALRLSGHGAGLRSLEVRTSPVASGTELLGALRAVDRALDRTRARDKAAGRIPTEFGLVLHFTKSRGGGAAEGTPSARRLDSEADPGRSRYRFADFYRLKRREALSIGWLLRRFPRSLEVLRGVDVSADELGVPNWVLSPLIDYVKRCAEAAARRLPGRADARSALRTSVHVGEDFIHLQSALRRIAETVHYLNLKEGDRLGHALALGLDASRWARGAGCLTVRREVRLFDLVWEWQWTAQGHVAGDGGRALHLADEIQRLSSLVFGSHLPPGVQVRDFVRFVEMLYSPRWLRLAGFPDGSVSVLEGCKETSAVLMHAYLTRSDVFERGGVTEIVNPGDDGPRLAALQKSLRRSIGARGIAVEMNPSSNLLVGNLADLDRHPFWLLRPPRQEAPEPSLAVCIGSDDPAVFATNLMQEYALVHDALVAGGLSTERAGEWIDRVRRSGLENRFTVTRSRRVLTEVVPAGEPRAEPLL